MILADKIILLRRRKGWSQEELAERLGVTRQSISKWEGAQSAPELDKILKMSEVFGVSCDFLLKDELEPEEVPLSAKKVTFENSTEDEVTEEEPPAAETAVEEAAKKEKAKPDFSLIENLLYPVIVLALVAYFILGFKLNAWGWAWVFPVVPFISVIVLNSLTDKSGENTPLENLGTAVCYTALLIFLLIGLLHGGWAWAWIIPVGAFVGLTVFRFIVDKKTESSEEHE